MPKTEASFAIDGPNVVMTTTYQGGAQATEAIGIWLAGDNENAMRLMARAFRAGRRSKAHDIKCALLSDD